MKTVLSVENMRMSDAAAQEIIPSGELMYRAGRAVFECEEWRYPAAVVCGSGNNAGDGYVIAGLMKDAGRECTVFMTSDRSSADGKYYLDICREKHVDIRMLNSETELSGYGTVFDCIFGTGFRGRPEGISRTAIEKINRSGAFIVAVDINSGLDGDSGLCKLCVDSDLTVSVGGIKSGLVLNAAKDHIKRIKNVDIGIAPVDPPFGLLEARDIASFFAPRKHFSHKGTYGYTALIGGSGAYSGAARLANLAAAALRSGTGVVRLAVPQSLAEAVMPYILESTMFPMPERDGQIIFDAASIDACLKGTQAAAVGMGIGTGKDIEEVLRHILKSYKGTAIIDADGLNVLSGMDGKVIREAACAVVLTPHLKEFSRLSGLTAEEILADPVKAAADYAQTRKCVLLLKGPATIVTDGDRVLLIDRGCAGMATAGSGDVLSGILAAICGYHRQDTLMAVAAAAYINGAAGEAAQEKIGDISMIASDTVAMLPRVIKELGMPCPEKTGSSHQN